MLCLVYLLILAAQSCAVVSCCNKRAKGVPQNSHYLVCFTAQCRMTETRESDAFHHAVLRPSPMLLHRFRLALRSIVVKLSSHMVIAHGFLGTLSADIAIDGLRAVLLTVIQDDYFPTIGSAYRRPVCIYGGLCPAVATSDDDYIDDDLL